jgi:hydrogenase nickel incorporation protein HypA/HybF
MHEVGIMQEGVRMAVETAKARQASRITRLGLRVGTMSGVVPDALRFAFDMVTRETLAEGAVLEIETVPATCWCGSCQAEFECADFLNECPRCRAWSGELRHGRELDLAFVEVT